MHNNPIATKRVVRAMLKAADVCAREPERAARYMVKNGYEDNYAIALEVVKEVSYNAWRTFDPDDTLRFHALRLHEVGMIKSSPQKIIAQGTDWRFLNELKRELKGVSAGSRWRKQANFAVDRQQPASPPVSGR